MKDFWEVIKKRKSFRDFKEEKIEREKIEKILEAGSLAPSAGNIKDYRFFVVEEKETKEKLAQAALNQKFLAKASIIIVVGSDLGVAYLNYGKRGTELYSICDAAAACQNILLAVEALDLKACWVGAFDEERVKEILGLEKQIRPIALIAVGYD